MANCGPKKISQLNYAEHLSDEAIFPIVLDEDNYVIQAKDLIDLIIKKITGADNPDALSIALYAKELAEHADSNADLALKDVASALAYATKAYQMVCQFEDRLSELESHWAFILKLKNTFYNLVEQISNLSIEIENLWNSKVVRIELSLDNNSTIYMFYQDDEKVGEVVVPRGGIYRGSQYISISSDNVISLKNLGRAAYTNNYWHLDNLPTKLSLFENDVPFLTADDLCCDDLYDLILKLTKRVEALERCCALMHNNYQVYLTLGEGVNANDTRALIEVVKGYKYVNQFTLKPGYENLRIVCTPNTATINNGALSIVVLSDVSIVVTATKTSITPTTHTISWDDPTEQVTINGESTDQETVNHGGIWSGLLEVPNGYYVTVVDNGIPLLMFEESGSLIFNPVNEDHVITFIIEQRTLYKFGLNDLNDRDIFFFGTQTDINYQTGQTLSSVVGLNDHFLSFTSKKLNTTTNEYEIFTGVMARLISPSTSNKITIGQCTAWDDRNNAIVLGRSNLEPYWVAIPIHILPKDLFDTGIDEDYRVELYYEHEGEEITITTVKISVKDLISNLYNDSSKPRVQFYLYETEGGAYAQKDSRFYAVIPPGGISDAKRLSTDVTGVDNINAATMECLVYPFGPKNHLTLNLTNGYIILGNEIIYCSGTPNEVRISLTSDNSWLRITNITPYTEENQRNYCILYTLEADSNTSGNTRYANVIATINSDRGSSKITNTYSSSVKFKQESI